MTRAKKAVSVRFTATRLDAVLKALDIVIGDEGTHQPDLHTVNVMRTARAMLLEAQQGEWTRP